jgi:hypothetical protein
MAIWALTIAHQAAAQDKWPSRPIKLIVPYAPADLYPEVPRGQCVAFLILYGRGADCAGFSIRAA